MDGILLLDKPAGWTSFDVVSKVRRTITADPALNVTRRKRFPVGHTGTLDPLATGLLVVLLGTYTKRAPQLTKLDKTYEVTMRLGKTSTTGDEEGEETTVSSVQPSREQILTALQKFQGHIMQTPPAFSAIKVNGQRAYKLARKGEMPQLQPRPVAIRTIQLTRYEYPLAEFTAEVSSGTYIRSLVEDVGQVLETGAYMSALRRTHVGRFDIKDAVQATGLSSEYIRNHIITLAEIAP